MRRLRVAMIIHGYYPRIGGAETQLGALAPVLQSRGLDIHVLTRHARGLAKTEMIQGIPVYRLPVPGYKPVASITFTLAALARLRRLRPDIIHAHELISPTTTALAAKHLLGTPVVVTVHRGGAEGEVARVQSKLLGPQRLAEFRKRVDAFVLINREIESDLAGLGVPSERRFFIPNGVDTRRFVPASPAAKIATRAALGLPNSPIVVYTGRLAPEKRVDLLVQVWPAVRQVHPDAQLLLLGAGPEEMALRQAGHAGIRFAGPTHDVLPYLQAADLFALPSAREGLSVALLEAMSSGLAVVATAVGGNLELIRHGENGWLVPPNDPRALQAALTDLLSNAKLRGDLGRCAREHIVCNYDLGVTATRLCELYERLVKEE